MIKAILAKLKRIYKFRVTFRSNRVTYMRYLGMRIGENVQIFSKTDIFGSEPWLIEIGNGTVIAAECQLITHDGASRMFRNSYPKEMSKWGDKYGPIIIGKNCFIGYHTIIMLGVTLGENTIVAAVVW